MRISNNSQNLNHVIETIHKTIRLIEKYSNADTAELKEQLNAIICGSQPEQLAALNQVCARCHPNAYGDIYMKDLPGSFHAWNKYLQHLLTSCQNAYQHVEAELEALSHEKYPNIKMLQKMSTEHKDFRPEAI
jgi:hypothetical protein